LPRALLADELGPQLMERYERRFDYVSSFLANALKEGSSPWCDDITTPEHEDCSGIAARALGDALEYLQSMQGSRIEDWRWDRIHVVVFPHQLAENNAILRRLFSRSIPNGGDRSTVNIGTFALNQVFEQRAAPGYRQLIDLSNTEPGRFIAAVGQSGHLLSPHYDDYLDDWQAGRYRPMRFDRAAVEAGRKASLRLVP
jgi:Protein related to penicillin acylase